MSQAQPNQEPQLTPKPLLTPVPEHADDDCRGGGTMVVRMEARLPPDAPAALQATVTAIGRSLVFRTPGDPAWPARSRGVCSPARCADRRGTPRSAGGWRRDLQGP